MKTGENNPVYQLNYSASSKQIRCFSKKYSDPENPQSGFAAIMNCSLADKNCPVIPGANFRIAVPYQDPKISDGKPEEAKTYDECCFQIATEMVFVMGLAR